MTERKEAFRAAFPPYDPGKHRFTSGSFWVRRAVTDDALVDRAAEINAQLAAERLDHSVIQPQVIEMYERVAVRAAMRE